jgi:thiol-disulfide isomerase/thioredoxin
MTGGTELSRVIEDARLTAMATGSKPVALQAAQFLVARCLGGFIHVAAAALVAAPMAFAQVQLTAQTSVENDSPKTPAPRNFIIHETPEPGVVLRFEDGEAQPHSLADFRGRIVLLNIWATWCPPCVKEIPALDRLVAALDGADVVVVAVSVDRKGIDAVRKAFADLDVQKLAPYIDRSGQALRTVRSMGLPTSLLIDREGRELGRVVGPAAWDDDASVAFFRQVGTPPSYTKR